MSFQHGYIGGGAWQRGMYACCVCGQQRWCDGSLPPWCTSHESRAMWPIEEVHRDLVCDHAQDARRFWRLARAMEMEPDPFRNKYQLDPAFYRLVVLHLLIEERLEATQDAAQRVLAVLNGDEMSKAEYELRAVLTEASPDPAVAADRHWSPSAEVVEDLNRDA